MTAAAKFNPPQDRARELIYGLAGTGLCVAALSQVFNPVALGITALFALSATVIGRQMDNDMMARSKNSFGTLTEEEASPLEKSFKDYSRKLGFDRQPFLEVGRYEFVNDGEENMSRNSVIIQQSLVNENFRHALFVVSHELSHLAVDNRALKYLRAGVTGALGILSVGLAVQSMLSIAGAKHSYILSHTPSFLRITEAFLMQGLGYAAMVTGMNASTRVAETRADRNAVYQTGDIAGALSYLGSIPTHSRLAALFKTHPAAAQRVENLRKYNFN